MFSDKNRPLSVSVSRVSQFYAAPGVKSCDTLDTDTHFARIQEFQRKQQRMPDGYILAMTTATGTWYYSGFSGEDTRLAWTQDIQRVKVTAAKIPLATSAARHQAEITDLFGPAIIGDITVCPVKIVNHRTILIDEAEL